MTPPTEPNFYLFRGHRIIRGNQRIEVNEPVQVIMIWDRGKKVLGVAMIGTQRRSPLSAFDGDWQRIEVAP